MKSKHSPTMLARRWLRWILLAAALSIAGFGALAQAPIEFSSGDAIKRLAEHLSIRRANMFAALSRIGLGREVRDLQQATVNQLHTLSADSILDSLYRRAETRQKGEGDRLIAALYRDAASRSAAVRDDPNLQKYAGMPAEELDFVKRPLLLASLGSVEGATSRPPLPPEADAALRVLSDYHGARGMAHLRTAALRTFRKPGFDSRKFDAILLQSRDPEGALRAMLDAGLPPPTTQEALHRLMVHAFAGSASFASNQAAVDAMMELSRELAPEHRSYLQAEQQLESRVAQFAEAGKQHLKGREARSEDGDILAALGRDNRDPSGGVPNAPGTGPTPGPQSGPAGNSPPEAHLNALAENYGKYDAGTFHPRGSSQASSARTPRSYKVARFSARAGRGVSAGAEVKSEVKQKIHGAMWISNPTDDRFGRLFVTLAARDGSVAGVASSREVFTDSFRAARSALWDAPRHEAARFTDGEILVLMSMDPDGPLSRMHFKQALERLTSSEQDQFVAAFDALQQGTSLPSAKREELAATARELVRLGTSRLPPATRAERDIVLHPALLGRELGWSAARIDFWTNQPVLLLREASEMNGGGAAPEAAAVLNEVRAATWQYYETDSTIRILPGDKRAARLVVESPGGNARSHFAVATFSRERGDDGIPREDGLFQRPGFDRKMQPLLDWLSTNHHDYMRLNDFSESFSLLRWLKREGIPVRIIDLAGERKKIAAPDRVDIRTGPKIGP